MGTARYEANRHFAWPIDGVDDGSETFPNKKETPAMKMQPGVPEVRAGEPSPAPVLMAVKFC